jgi:hypothetical protein
MSYVSQMAFRSNGARGPRSLRQTADPGPQIPVDHLSNFRVLFTLPVWFTDCAGSRVPVPPQAFTQYHTREPEVESIGHQHEVDHVWYVHLWKRGPLVGRAGSAGAWLLPPRMSDPNSDSCQRSIRTPTRTSVASRKLPAHNCASINRRTPQCILIYVANQERDVFSRLKEQRE